MEVSITSYNNHIIDSPSFESKKKRRELIFKIDYGIIKQNGQSFVFTDTIMENLIENAQANTFH